ncbi:MAG: S8 family serine peptidase [Anaerolineae bacterium]
MSRAHLGKLLLFLAPPMSLLALSVALAAPADFVSVIVVLRDAPTLRPQPSLARAARLESVTRSLQEGARRSRAPMEPLLQEWQRQGVVRGFMELWVVNGFALEARSDVISQLANHPQVLRLSFNRVLPGPEPPGAIAAFSADAWHLEKTAVPAVWAYGFRGQGVVVANMDTGVSLNDTGLVRRWRGGSNSWFDPYGEHPLLPYDGNGHGTATMGLLVGDEVAGKKVGVAPAAAWIAVRIFNDHNQATTTALHLSFQWLLDPDGNPASADAPQVVCGSWAIAVVGCDPEFQLDLQALRAAGILPVFAAGNYGPNQSSGVSPGNYPEAISVGATDSRDGLYFLSSRGPSACPGFVGQFPRLVAPGVSITSIGLAGSTYFGSGTSLAAPQVAGVLALLLSAWPQASPEEAEAALLAGVTDLGPTGPDNGYGYGRLNAMASLRLLVPGLRYQLMLPIVALRPEGRLLYLPLLYR